jgi:hypothetical protein
MEALFVVTLMAVVLGVAAFALRAQTRQRHERTEALHAYARRRGWTFVEKPAAGVVAEMERFELFEQGRDRTIANFMAGADGAFRVAVFDYSFVTGSGKSRTVQRQTVASMHGAGLALPAFSLRPEHMFHRFAQVFGYQDIDLAERPEFSRRFLLRGVDEHAVRAAFSTTVAEFLESRPRCCAAGEGPLLFFWRPGRHARPEEVDELLADATGLATRLTAGMGARRTM